MKPTEMLEHQMGSLKLWTPASAKLKQDGVADRSLTPPEKIAQEKRDQALTEKAEVRQEHCWKCRGVASAWVREVQFDIYSEGASIDHAAVSSANYPGPVPGFCIGCIASGPQELAQAVYFDRSEMYWGFRPNRWFVIFTDGTKQGGSTVSLAPDVPTATVQDVHLASDGQPISN